MTRPRLLDLFCGAGGAAMGYHRAGFDVVGVDNRPQPHYPFEFVKCDAIRILIAAVEDVQPWPRAPWFDAIHVSPPCQDHARGGSHPVHGTSWMLPATRFYLQQQNRPWIIENVPGACRVTATLTATGNTDSGGLQRPPVTKGAFDLRGCHPGPSMPRTTDQKAGGSSPSERATLTSGNAVRSQGAATVRRLRDRNPDSNRERS